MPYLIREKAQTLFRKYYKNLPLPTGRLERAFDQKPGFPEKYVAPNLTPFNLQNRTDGEIFRVITAGVSKDVGALFPLMP